MFKEVCKFGALLCPPLYLLKDHILLLLHPLFLLLQPAIILQLALPFSPTDTFRRANDNAHRHVHQFTIGRLGLIVAHIGLPIVIKDDQLLHLDRGTTLGAKKLLWAALVLTTSTHLMVLLQTALNKFKCLEVLRVFPYLLLEQGLKDLLLDGLDHTLRSFLLLVWQW